MQSYPDDVDPGLWTRYIKGARAFDQLWGSGRRCPSNPAGARCKCDRPATDYCQYWTGVADLAEKIGGATARMVVEMG